MDQIDLKRCKHITPLLQEVITSDASLKGWGAHYHYYAVQGRWTFKTQNVVSNILEMKAAFQVLLAFSPLLRGKEVLLKLDNRVAVTYINRQGGTRSLHDAGSLPSSRVGTAEPGGTNGNVRPRSSKETGRLSKPEFCIQQRVGFKPPSFFPHNQNLGDTGYRPGSDTDQHEMPEVSGESSFPISRGHGLSTAQLELPSGVHLFTDSPHSKIPTQTQEVRVYSDSNPPL